MPESIKLLSFVFRTAWAIPIAAAHEDRNMMEQAFKRVDDTLAEGELVCIFPEGKITENGDLNEFKVGILRIHRTNAVPIIPLALRGLWGGFFSRAHGRALLRLLPRGLLSRIELVAGEPLHEREVELAELRHRVAELRGQRL